MDLPTIHCCNMLTSENEKLSKKYHKLTKKYKILEKRFHELKDELKEEQIETEKNKLLQSIGPGNNAPEKENKDTRRNYQAKVALSRNQQSAIKMSQRKFQVSEDKTNKILSMHNELIKKYEKEMKLNTSRTERITKLALEKSDMQKQLHEQKELIGELQKQLEAKERLQKCQKVKNRLTPKASELKRKLSSVEDERDSLREENLRLKGELGCLDKGFFEEIEDLKYALQKSARLNTEYEKALKKICSQFGVQYQAFMKEQDRKIKRRSRNREFKS